MRSLSSALLAAQQSASHVPYVQVEIHDRRTGVPRLPWTRLYTGAEEDYFHAVTVAGDGSLVRARTVSAGTLYYQHSAAPGPGSAFGTWTSLGAGAATGAALCAQGASVFLFSVASDGRTLQVRESSDNGATLGDPQDILTAAAAVTWLAADATPGGTVALFYTVGAQVWTVVRSGGTWGAPAARSNSVLSLTGLACTYQNDWNLALSGQEAGGGYRVWTAIYGDGYAQAAGTWSTLAEVAVASPGAGVEYHAPLLAAPDVHRLLLVEAYTGTQGYSRPYQSHTVVGSDFVDNRWREPVPLDLTSGYGVALASGVGWAWRSTPWGVWRASLTPATVEVTADVLGLEVEDTPTGGRLLVELRNDDGRYNSPGAGAYAALTLGAEVRVSPGYQTASGPLSSGGPVFWLTGWEHRSLGGRATLVLRAVDGWGLLGRWVARRQFAWAAGSQNIFQLLGAVLARAGLALSSFSTSSAVVDRSPAFTIHPGEAGAQAVHRLLAQVPDVLLFRGSTGYLKHPIAAEASAYSYGGAHPILEGRYRTQMQDVNRAQVFGSGVFAEAATWTEIEEAADRLRQVHDLNLTTGAVAQERADAELRRAAFDAAAGELRVPANCGQEVYDVIDITDNRAGVSGALRRVLGLRLVYDARPGRPPRYEHHLTLGGV
ncbi:MAG: hypothetical protein HY689_16145 [Chloroflexi bacterium]|nr:hypothetical protein [Chloroflexota bacterium]